MAAKQDRIPFRRRMREMKLTIEFLRVIMLDWAMDESMLWHFKSSKWKAWAWSLRN